MSEKKENVVIIEKWPLEIVDPKSPIGEILAKNAIWGDVNGRFYHITGVDAGDYFQPIVFEHGNNEKIGDVILTIRKHPKTKRWMIEVEKEKVFVSETETIEVWRATRSSIGNPEQSIKRAVVKVGEGYSNPRRIGGKPIFQHYIILPWSPQIADKMMDVYDYLDTPDMIGQSVLSKALRHMSDKDSREIYNQMMRVPPTE